MTFNASDQRKPATEGRSIALSLASIAIGIASLCLVILSISVPSSQSTFSIPMGDRVIFAIIGMIALYGAASLIDWIMDSLTEKEHQAIDETDIYSDYKEEEINKDLWESEKQKRYEIRLKCDQAIYRFKAFGYGYFSLALALSLFLGAIVSLGIEQFTYSESYDLIISISFPIVFGIILILKMLTLRSSDNWYIFLILLCFTALVGITLSIGKPKFNTDDNSPHAAVVLDNTTINSLSKSVK